MVKENLTAAQLQEAKQLDKIIKQLANIKETFSQYKLDDFYILEEFDKRDPKNVHVEKTHMGFPVKFKVVYISPEGVPHLRKLTVAGNPTGEAVLPPEAAQLNFLRRLGQVNSNSMVDDVIVQRFVPDPEHMDAIILQNEFDPMELHREKSKLFNDINRHNKRVAVPTGYNAFNKIGDFFKSKQPGDKFWTAPGKQFVIQSVIKQGREWEITCTDMNQATVTFNFSHFQHKRLYREEPRSFRQEAAI